MKLSDLLKFKLFRKMPQKTGNHLEDFYNRIDEDSRLTSKHGKVEFLTTVKYIEKYLKDGMKIIEIGAATGRYSHYFAQKGFEVDAVELIEHNIEIFKSKTKENEKITIRQGNAIDLSEISDNRYDITLLLGPMYHLYSEEDQKRALSEAVRITKEDGIIFVAYCMVEPSVLTGIFKPDKVQQSIEDGLINTETFETFFPPHGIFKLYTRDEIFALTKKLNAERLHFIATDGYSLHMREVIDKMNTETYNLYLKYHFKTCERQDLVGMSHHTLDIIRKNLTIYQPPTPNLGGKVFFDISKIAHIASNFLYIKKNILRFINHLPSILGAVGVSCYTQIAHSASNFLYNKKSN